MSLRENFEEDMESIILALRQAEQRLPYSPEVKKAIQSWHHRMNQYHNDSAFFEVKSVHRDDIARHFDQKLADNFTNDDMYYLASEMGDALGEDFWHVLGEMIENRFGEMYNEYKVRNHLMNAERVDEEDE